MLHRTMCGNQDTLFRPHRTADFPGHGPDTAEHPDNCETGLPHEHRQRSTLLPTQIAFDSGS